MVSEEKLEWKGRLEFVLTSFGFTVGLGNLWRFPYKCYVNGGGSFVIAYLLTVVLCSIPMIVLEMSIGQLTQSGVITAWSVCPLMQGVGWGVILNLAITTIYYVIPIMYAMYYMTVSFINIGDELPWQRCRAYDSWTTDKCRSNPAIDMAKVEPSKKIETVLTLMDVDCVEMKQESLNISNIEDLNVEDILGYFDSCWIQFRSPEEEYWNRFVLRLDDTYTGTGGVVGKNAVMLVVIWLFISYCCFRGIRSIAKVMYITVGLPFLLMLIMCVRGLTLPGYQDGVRYLFNFDTNKMSDLNLWASAATQAIYSLGVGHGGHILLASYNKRGNNIVRDAILVALANVLTSFISAVAVFSFIGHMSFRLDKDIMDLFDHGPGLLFIVYTQGISLLPAPAIWSCVFYLMVFSLAVDSQVVMVWTVYHSVFQTLPGSLKQYRTYLLLACCAMLCLLGLPLVTKGGVYLFVILEKYSADFILVIFIMLESVAICWLYGANDFIKDINVMVGSRRKFLWRLLSLIWAFGIPLFCLFVLLATAIGYKRPSYNGVDVATSGEVIGWLITLTSVMVIVLVALIQIRRVNGFQNAIRSINVVKEHEEEAPGCGESNGGYITEC